MSEPITPQQAFLDRIASPEGLPIIQFQNGDTINVIRSKDATVFVISAKSRLEGGKPVHLASIVFNDHFPRIQPDHLEAVLGWIKENG